MTTKRTRSKDVQKLSALGSHTDENGRVGVGVIEGAKRNNMNQGPREIASRS